MKDISQNKNTFVRKQNTLQNYSNNSNNISTYSKNMQKEQKEQSPIQTTYSKKNQIKENENIPFQFDDDDQQFQFILNEDDIENNNILQQINNNFLKSFKSETTDTYINKLDFSIVNSQQPKDYIFVFGGFVENNINVIERYDIQQNNWDQVYNLDINRAKFSVVQLDNKVILIMGGKKNGLRVSQCEEFNLQQNIIQSSNISLTSPKSGFGVLNLGDNKIIVVGGNDGQSIQYSTELYDLNNLSVIKLENMNEKRDELAIAQGLDKRIYAIGGFGGKNNICLKTVERYDFQTEKWQTIASLNTPRRALCAVTLPDGIYAIGGFDGTNYLCSVEKYDESLNQWSYISNMNNPRCTLSAVISQDNQYIYVFGGFDNVPLNSVERYNLVEDKWEIIQNMKFSRFMHNSILIEEDIQK
ncbi:kelch-like 12, putative [Ichthyophthirius multifiliis]|uniref:Kelch-like 12, putative n=1 Tax=Ichthyophthirius multifiliis TaxID=5932 RepID=G0QUA0_ICHMU|nr:kelch-like 12, putative [Ichthyophthirius multifiliis]EGR31203.1 kelch-like 12, putative [Ichthyophthirius multifiliis]|eukprot:XP_004034689.1 kelch-like 12, putative [Ichthyophthirius multifiliis]